MLPGWLRDGSEVVTDREGLGRVWRSTYERKRWTPRTDEEKAHRAYIQAEVGRAEKSKEVGEGGGKIGMKEMKGARMGSSKDGDPGKDLVTHRMLERGGTDFDGVILDIHNRIIEIESTPPQCKEDVSVPLHKRGGRHSVKNFRPVSLVLVILKEFQRIMYGRLNGSEPGKKLTGDFNFGSVKGRDRHMLLWLVNASCLWEMCTGGKGGRMILGAWDVDNAFPSMWQDGVDWMMWQAGVRGKMWRVLREMEKRLRGTVRINGHFLDMKVHEDGGNQGSVSAPHRWKYMMGGWFKHCVDKGLGVEVGGEKFPGGGYVDDATMLAYNAREMALMKKERDIFGGLWGFSWKIPKDQYMVRGNRKGMIKDVLEMAKLGMKVQDIVLVLGESLGWNPDRCPAQCKMVIGRMRSAIRVLEWAAWKGSVMGADMLESLFGVMVESIARSHLVHTRLLQSEFDELDALKAGVGKKFLGVSKDSSRWGVLSELGWASVSGGIIGAKLGFYGRLRLAEDGGLVQKWYKIMFRLIEADSRMEGLGGSWFSQGDY